MTLSTQAYKAMLIAQVQQGNMTPKKATRLFNSYLEETTP